jgi:C-terminal processing protease CtpA/Prc
MMKDLRNTKAIIFDFRNYPEFMIDEVMSYLVPEPKSFAKFIQPDFAYPGRFEWTESVQTGRHNLDPYKGRVLMLVNEDTQSRSEYFAMAMQTVEGSITVGRQTSAADGDVLDFTFFDDKTSWITGRGVFYPDGRETQRIGIHIDVEVPLTLEDINNGRDAIFEKAVEIARQ